MENWLKDRLSPVKSETDRWTELAEAIQQFWEENFDLDVARLVALRSIFTAQNDDKTRRLVELGKYYDVDIQDGNIPMAVIQRRVELFQKDTLVPLMESLRRACPGIVVEWRPLYALDNQGYDDGGFYTEEELIRLGHSEWLTNISHMVDGSWDVCDPTTVFLTTRCYMTSRGKLWIDETNIDAPELIEASIRGRVALTKPLHIVFDGLIWSISIEIPANDGLVTAWQKTISSNPCQIFPCILAVDGAWLLDGTQFLCSDHSEICHQYPATTEAAIISYASIDVGLSVHATYIDGTLVVDGTWDLLHDFS